MRSKQNPIKSLTYHLKELVKIGNLKKEKRILLPLRIVRISNPYLSDKKSPLTVILILIGNSKQVFIFTTDKNAHSKTILAARSRLLAENQSTMPHHE
jgi:hypothetical protein